MVGRLQDCKIKSQKHATSEAWWSKVKSKKGSPTVVGRLQDCKIKNQKHATSEAWWSKREEV